MSLCERPGCSLPGAAAYGMVAEELTFWIDHLNDAVFAGVLCSKHADSLSVPRGWTLIDRRDPDLHLFSLRSSKASELPPRTARSSAHPPGQAVEQLQIDCGFEGHGAPDPIRVPTVPVQPPTPVAAPPPAAAPSIVVAASGNVAASNVDDPGDETASPDVHRAPTRFSSPVDHGQTQHRAPHEAVEPDRRAVGADETDLDQLALALDSTSAARTSVGHLDAAAASVEATERPAVTVRPGGVARASDFPPPIITEIGLADVDQLDGDELPLPDELPWIDRHDQRHDDRRDPIVAPSDHIDRGEPTGRDAVDCGPLGETTETVEATDTAPTPWMPTFDHNDDLDGMLDVTSPLLRRAFHGDDLA